MKCEDDKNEEQRVTRKDVAMKVMEHTSSWEANSRSARNCLPFMEPKNLLPCSKEFATGSYLHPDESSPYPHTHFIKIRFHISLPSMSNSSK